jgi:hypothetical protein
MSMSAQLLPAITKEKLAPYARHTMNASVHLGLNQRLASTAGAMIFNWSEQKAAGLEQ